MSGAAIRVHRIRTVDKSVELLVRGAYSDAAYVRDTLGLEADVNAGEPTASDGVPGMWLIQADRVKGDPLTVALVTRMLERDENIRIMPKAVR